MTNRSALVTGLATLITALDSGAPVALWPGEDRAFNPDAARPSLWVRYLGAEFGPDKETGAITYDRRTRWQVVVQHDDHAALLTLLDALEAGLHGVWLGDGQLELDSETQERAEGGVYTYAQAWTLGEYFST